MPVYFPGSGLPAGVKPVGFKAAPSGRSVLTDGNTEFQPGLVVPPSSPGIVISGDSRCDYTNSRYGIAATSPTGIPSSGSGGIPIYIDFRGVGAECDLSSTGLWEYDAATDRGRWTAAGDTAGPWTPLPANETGSGEIDFPSGSYNKYLYAMIWWRPAASTSINVTCAAIRTNHNGGWQLKRHGLFAGIRSAFPTSFVRRCGVGGSTLSDQVKMIPWYLSNCTVGGKAVHWGGTNDINSAAGLTLEQGLILLEEMKSNGDRIMSAYIEQGGQDLVWPLEHARWAGAAGSPMSAVQQTIHAGWNAYLLDRAENKFKGRLRVPDAYSRTVNPAYTDRRPLTGVPGALDVVYDSVHLTATGMAPILSDIVEALRDFGLRSYPFTPKKGDVGLVDFNGISWFGGSGGTVGAGCTSSTGMPASVSCSSTANVTATWDKVPSRESPGTAMEWTYSSVAGASQYTRIVYAGVTLANAGLVVGDRRRFYADVEVDAAGPNDTIKVIISFVRSGKDTISVELEAPSLPGKWRCFGPPVYIPSGTDSLSCKLEIWTDTASPSAGKGRVSKVLGWQ